jgi:protein phosphatase
VVHVGDTRVYRINHGTGIQKVTSDHTLVEKLLEDGQISEKEANEHPRKNILYMSVGVSKKISPTVIKDIKIEEGDIFLLCSDGLSNMISEEEILDICVSHLPKDAVEKLIKSANNHGGLDNISVQVINIGQNEFLNKTKILTKRELKSKNILLLFIGILFILTIIIITALQFI